MIKKGERKGQVTIFIIIAVLIIALAILIYLYYPKIIASFSTETKNPASMIQECIQEQIEDNVQIISLQGGNYVVDSNSGYFYKKEEDSEGKYVKYLCYTSQDLQKCISQEPFLTEHVEAEILNSISTEVDNCFNNMVRSYDNKGYEVNLKRGEAYVEIIPNLISTNLNSTLTLTKADETQTYRNFNIDLNSNLYDILEVAKNIIIWEMNVGDSLPEAYMYNNPNLRVEKHRKGDDTKIYVLTDINTEESFRFAVRSIAAPVGLA
jgi:hypothetical protein